MALLRLLCSPSTSHFSNPQFFSSAPSFRKPSSNTSTISLNPSPLSPTISHSIPLKPRLLLFPVSSSSQAQATIEEASKLDDSDSSVQEEEEEGGGEEDEASRTRLLAQNVPWTATPDDIRLLFEKYGSVVDVELSMYNKTRNRGLAFVSMGSHEEAMAALNGLESNEYEGRVLKLTWAKPKKEKPPPPVPQPKPMPVHNLFVANLPFQARAKDLKEFFNSGNANVVSAEIIFYENPRGSAGYGFVSFNTKKEADAALFAFQGKMFMGRPIRVAPSKRFLRQETKKNIDSKDTLSPEAEQSEKAEAVEA